MKLAIYLLMINGISLIFYVWTTFSVKDMWRIQEFFVCRRRSFGFSIRKAVFVPLLSPCMLF